MSNGTWETRLRALSTTATDVQLPAADRIRQQFDDLKSALDKAASQSGLQGQADEAATTALSSVSTRAANVSASLESVQNAVEHANERRRDLAHHEINSLDQKAPASLSGTEANILQSAVSGALFTFGPLSIVAGAGAVGIVNNFLAANRESHAREAVQRIGEVMDDMAPEPPARVPAPENNRDKDGTSSSSSTSRDSTGGGPRGGIPAGGSFSTYPGAHIEPLSQVDTGGVISFPHTGGSTGGGHTGTGVTPGTGIDGSITPDGPISGGSTTPGLGSGGSGSGLGGGNGGGLGSTPGLAAGAGGALALGGAKLVAARGGSMLGSGLNAKVGSLGAGGAGGKLGGLSGAAESAAARSGSLAGAGRAGTGGLLGSGSGSGAAGAAGEGAAARGGAGAGMMGGAGGAGRSDEKRQGRGLGGPIAPKIDEDQERGPRSASAGPGGRG
ncbi:hypothetical protein [Leifsonia sp. 71-9]|uniref:hypothetical protein n=1 Tax=Leifsonia sp. 71-9 TaxID=1895934 RepID=UPI000ABF9741|nr:hypothetical protein [Leifsonia sp. 71-9]